MAEVLNLPQTPAGNPERSPTCCSPGILHRAGWLAFCSVPLALAVLAGIEFRGLRQILPVEIPLSAAALEVTDEIVYGDLNQGWPSRRLRWDGQPAQAQIVDTASGEVLAPSLLDPDSLSLNRSGVLWEKGSCRFVLNRETYDKFGSTLALRFEKLRSSTGFYVYSVLALLVSLGGLCARQIAAIRRAAPGERRARLLHELRVSSFVGISLFSAFTFYPGIGTLIPFSDAENINGFAAGLNSPESFIHDALLANPRNFAWYTPLYVKTIQFSGWLGFHYATGLAFLALVSTLVGLFGYFRLFTTISGSQAFGYAAALSLCFLKQFYPPDELWSPVMVLPRTVYGDILPWVVYLALCCLTRPRRWPLAAAAAGLLFYVHPVSSPALTGAILVGMLFASKRLTLKRFAWSVTSAATAIAVMLPYICIYAGKYAGTVKVDQATLDQALACARAPFAPGYLDIDVYAWQLVDFFARTPRFWPGLVALAALVLFCRKARAVRVFCGMGVGFGIVMVVIPLVDLVVANQLGRLPFQIDLIRNIRYADVFLLALIGVVFRESRHLQKLPIWSFRLGWNVGRFESLRSFPVPARVAVALLVLAAGYGDTFVANSRRMLEQCSANIQTLSGKPIPEVAAELELRTALRALRRPHEVVSGPLNLRQEHIPLAPLKKDLGSLAYANPAGLVKAKSALDRSEPYLVWPVTLPDATAAADILGADLLVLKRELAAPSLVRSDAVLFQNATSLIVRITKPQSTAQSEPTTTSALELPETSR